MIIFGFVLGLENLSREMQVGTYVIVVSTILLPIVGPGIQEGQNAQYLLSKPYAIIWSIILLVGMLGSAIYVYGVFPFTKISRCKVYQKFIILLTARATCFTLNLTASRVFILKPGTALIIISIAIKIVSGAIYTWAIVVQSTEVVQSKFVPLNATCLMLLNAVTGIIIWEDWRVIESWVGYVCVFLLLALASYLLLSSTPLMTSENPEYGQRAHFRRQLKRSQGSRTLMRIDLGSSDDDSSLEDSSNDGNGDAKSYASSELSEGKVGKAVDESDNEGGEAAGTGENVRQKNGAKVDDASGVQAEEKKSGLDDTGMTQTLAVEKNGDESSVDLESPRPSPRPRMERAMTKREAWQSIYHLPHVPKKH